MLMPAACAVILQEQNVHNIVSTYFYWYFPLVLERTGKFTHLSYAIIVLCFLVHPYFCSLRDSVLVGFIFQNFKCLWLG